MGKTLSAFISYDKIYSLRQLILSQTMLLQWAPDTAGDAGCRQFYLKYALTKI
ncbi:hypothetical protein [Pseudocitrobacter cyperus]|uniref:hypothetical protein n=1 Tax=Pseudocitrobacter cyperus TaxID=3112843 RepID=UPI0032601CC7